MKSRWSVYRKERLTYPALHADKGKILSVIAYLRDYLTGGVAKSAIHALSEYAEAVPLHVVRTAK
jgi:hypothetical protein